MFITGNVIFILLILLWKKLDGVNPSKFKLNTWDLFTTYWNLVSNLCSLY